MRRVAEVISQGKVFVDGFWGTGVVGFFTEEEFAKVIEANHFFGLL